MTVRHTYIFSAVSRAAVERIILLVARTLRRMSTRGRSNENNLQKLECSLQMTGDIRETGDTQGTQA